MVATRVRMLREAELELARSLWIDAYVVDGAALRMDMMRRIRAEDCRGIEVDGEVVCVGRLLELESRIAGRRFGVGGVASIATALSARRQGHVERILAGMLAEMRRRDMALSALYPFAFAFYARYGWAIADEKRLVTVPARLLVRRGRSRPPGKMVTLGADDSDEMRALHARWGEGYNLSAVRSPWWFEHYVLLQGRTTAPPRRLAGYRDTGGALEGYVMFQFRSLGGGGERRVAEVLELVATTAAARRALLGFLGDLDSQAVEVELRGPIDDPILAELGAIDGCRVANELGAMWRVVDVAAALSGWPAPGRRAPLTVAVDDDFCKWNRGTWRLGAEGGRTTLRPAREAADVELSIGTLAQLLTGYLGADRAAAAGLVGGRRPERAQAIAALSGGRVPFFNDYF